MKIYFFNNAARNMGMKISIQDSLFSFLQTHPNVRLLDHILIFSFYFLRKLYSFLSIFCSSSTILYSHQQHTKVSVFPHPLQQLIFFKFCFSLYLYNGYANRWYLIILICISLKIKAAPFIEHLFIYLLATGMASLEKFIFIII